MNEKAIREAVYKTLAYFDAYNTPLTKEELFRYMWESPKISHEEFVLSLRDIAPGAMAKQSLGFQNEVASENDGIATTDSVGIAMTEKYGYYFLPGKEASVEARRRATIPSDQKLKKAKRAAWFIRSVPFLRAVFICNSVAMEAAGDESDIDLFIVTAPNRVWLVRLFTNILLKIFGLRVGAFHSANKVCLSFYADAEHLNFSNIRIAEDDIYLAYWLHLLLPLYDPDNYQRKILDANGWTRKYLSNIDCDTLGSVDSPLGRGRGGFAGRFWKKMWEAMWRGAYGDMVEGQAKEMQMLKLKLAIKEKAKVGDKGVILGKGMIKLHENDRRSEIRDKWMGTVRQEWSATASLTLK